MKIINLHQNEKELIDLAVKNNPYAQEQIYSKFSAKMLGVCRQYIKDMQQAEDVMITGFMKVFSHINTFENKGSFEGWIRRIMVNESISFIRANKTVHFITDESFFEESYDPIENELSIADIHFLIDNLPDGYKIIFNLYAIEGYKHQEISKMLGISEGTSKSQLSHARQVLQKNIKKLKNYKNGTA